MKQFEEQEKQRYAQAIQRLEGKQKRQMNELQAETQSRLRELEQIQVSYATRYIMRSDTGMLCCQVYHAVRYR